MFPTEALGAEFVSVVAELTPFFGRPGCKRRKREEIRREEGCGFSDVSIDFGPLHVEPLSDAAL